MDLQAVYFIPEQREQRPTDRPLTDGSEIDHPPRSVAQMLKRRLIEAIETS